MLRKPNEGKNNMGIVFNNQIARRFATEFRILMDPGYYEGTKYAEYFNVLNSDDTSAIYVKDPLEEKIKEFILSDYNQMKFLVGLTGMGKTTLLRNVFKITDRGIHVSNNQYIIYISFYYASLSLDRPYESLKEELESYLSSFAEALINNNKALFKGIENGFCIELYDYIEKNKPTLLSNSCFSPDQLSIQTIFLRTIEETEKIERLKYLYLHNRFDYFACLIKYLLHRIGRKYQFSIVFDDIEAKPSIFHGYIIDIARHLYSCLNASEDKLGIIKVLVALRAYSFRSSVDRIAEARRETIEKDTILKDKTVSLHDIFQARFLAIKQRKARESRIGNIISYETAKRELDYVESKLDYIGSELIYNLSNYNLCNSMVVYTKLMSNLEWISYGEEDEKGAFILDKKHYKITTNNILRAIAMGNLKYYDGKSECIPNIIQHNGFGTELVSLYVIRYMLNNNYRGVYGDSFIEGTELLNNLVDLLCGLNSQISNRSKWSSLFGGAIAYLYNKGILFRSLYDIETEDPSMIKRQYDNSYKLYLSPRGEMLYNLLATNGVLMEIYRDDVATEIKNNDKISSELNATERFIYSLNMVEWLFGIEQSIAVQCFWNIKKYIDYIGKSFISTHILLGVASNIKLYYTENKTEQQDEVVEKIETIANKMKNYVDQINGLYGNSFTSEEIEAIQNIIEEVANQEKD